MNIDMVVIDANKTIGKNPVLVDVTPAYVYENGKRTGEVSGFKYTIALPDDGLEMRPYWTPEGYKVMATAKSIRTQGGNSKA